MLKESLMLAGFVVFANSFAYADDFGSAVRLGSQILSHVPQNTQKTKKTVNKSSEPSSIQAQNSLESINQTGNKLVRQFEDYTWGMSLSDAKSQASSKGHWCNEATVKDPAKGYYKAVSYSDNIFNRGCKVQMFFTIETNALFMVRIQFPFGVHEKSSDLMDLFGNIGAAMNKKYGKGTTEQMRTGYEWGYGPGTRSWVALYIDESLPGCTVDYTGTDYEAISKKEMSAEVNAETEKALGKDGNRF